MTRQIVLIHGPCNTGECWELVKPELERRGFTVHTPTLRGHRGNPRSAFMVSMDSYADDVLSCLREIGEPAVVLGHSTAGAIISAAAERLPEAFESLIYLSAHVPRAGRSRTAQMAPPGELLTKTAKLHLNGTVTIPDDVAREAFFHRCTPEVQERALTLMCPQPVLGSISTITVSDAKLGSVPKSYIETTDDQALPIASQRAMQANQKFDRIESIDTDNSPFYSRPAALADAIVRVTAS